MEFIAVILAVVYLLLAVKQNIFCWAAAISSSSLYFFVMYSAGLYMEAYLQIFYILMAFYGWSQWKEKETPLKITNWSTSNHLKAMSLILFLSISSGYLLDLFTDAALPFLDALTTWGAVVATYMVAKKLIENWIYWFVVDTISIFLFLSRLLNSLLIVDRNLISFNISTVVIISLFNLKRILFSLELTSVIVNKNIIINEIIFFLISIIFYLNILESSSKFFKNESSFFNKSPASCS